MGEVRPIDTSSCSGGGGGMRRASVPSTPTRRLVDTSVGVREAAKHLARVRLTWDAHSPPRRFLLVTKLDDAEVIQDARDVVLFLLDEHADVSVHLQDIVLRRMVPPPPQQHQLRLRTWTADAPTALNADDIDVVITLGGDGTVLYASWLFQSASPPLLPFHRGTLGFLTVFDFSLFQIILKRIMCCDLSSDDIQRLSPVQENCNDLRRSLSAKECSEFAKLSPYTSGLRVNLRMRFQCSVHRKNSPANDSEDEVFHILNDLVVDRGPSPYMSHLEVYGDGVHLTTVQADGLVVSTPTGSTAYSLSAGGSLVHPDVPAMLLTPICPHTLSFRPMLLPDSMELNILVPPHSRNTAFASFDGRHRIELKQGDKITVQTSPFPVPTVCLVDQTTDWFHGLARCLRWNERVVRK